MTEDDFWIYLDGPEPDDLRPLLVAMRQVPPPTPEDKARVRLAFREMLDADRPPDPEPVADDPPRDAAAPAGDGSATLRAPSLVERIDPPAPPPLVEAPAPAAPARRAPAHLAAMAPLGLTTEALQRMGELPFQPDSPEKQSPVKRAPKTLLAARMKVGAETFPLGTTSVPQAVAAVPFVGSGVPDAIVLVPALTLKQYASLCAELALRPPRPGRSEETILVDYGVLNGAVRAALDEHWEKVFGEQPGMRVEFERCFVVYTAHLLKQVREQAR